MPALVLEHVTKRFGRVIAVNQLSMRVEPGEFVTLLGPSGCGKSTTLNMIAGLETIDEGQIIIGDTLVNHLQPKDRDVAMVFQNYALYPHMTVFDNMAFPLRARRVPRTEIGKIVNSVANTLGIKGLLDRLPKQLSGGQRQRVALGRAMVRCPRVFLMDEPLSNLDAKLRIQMRAELRHLHDSLKITTVYVTHDQAEAMMLSDRIAVIDNGMLQQMGTPREVYNQPLNLFVAGFLGSYPMNFFDSALHGGTSPYLSCGEFHYTLLQPMADYLSSEASNSHVCVGIRPEHVYIALTETPNAIPGEIYVVEQMGSDTLVEVSTGSQRFTARMGPDFEGRPHDRTWLILDPTRLYVFDSTTNTTLWWGKPAKASNKGATVAAPPRETYDWP
ncbi:MAG: ABC transporter ATP-binding protein [Chloroflexi bacterium]|nr:ABC transporter ATP-binding protein [Chloroflexota bacterium]